MPDSLDQELDTIARHPFREVPPDPRGGYVVDVFCRWIEREVAGAA